MSCPSLESWIEALDTGHAEPDGAHADCGECGRNRQQAEQLLGLLREAVAHSTLSDEAFVRRVLARRRHRPYWLAFTLVPVAAAAAALLLWMPPSDEPVARGGGGICQVSEVTPRGLRRIESGARVAENAALAFAVRNPASGERWLGIFAVAADRRVAWYHPAYESATDAPSLPRLPPGYHVLREQVSLPLGSGEVRVFCWLSDRPWPVAEADEAIERAVAGADEPIDLERVPALGGRQESERLWFGER